MRDIQQCRHRRRRAATGPADATQPRHARQLAPHLGKLRRHAREEPDVVRRIAKAGGLCDSDAERDAGEREQDAGEPATVSEQDGRRRRGGREEEGEGRDRQLVVQQDADDEQDRRREHRVADGGPGADAVQRLGIDRGPRRHIRHAATDGTGRRTRTREMHRLDVRECLAILMVGPPATGRRASPPFPNCTEADPCEP